MSKNLKTLLTIAAENRVVGISWESIARKVHRKTKTCQGWPARHRSLWDNIYREAQAKRFEATSNECHLLLANLTRDEDPKIRAKALELWMKYGAAAYGREGTMAPPPLPDGPKSPNETMIRNAIEEWNYSREQFDKRRARAGLPPATDEEFLEEHERQMTEILGPPKFDRPSTSIKIPLPTIGSVLPMVLAIVVAALLWADRGARQAKDGAMIDADRPRCVESVGGEARLAWTSGPRSVASHEEYRNDRPTKLTTLVIECDHDSLLTGAAMSIPLYLVDSFTDRPFAGNPAGVCLAESSDAKWMQSVATEMNQAETAFLRPRPDGDWDLRWFTPTMEVDLCGHATLASAHVLWSTGRVAGVQPIGFHTRSGVLTCRRHGELIEMDFPAEPAKPVASPAEEGLLLGVTPVFVGRNRMDMLVVLGNAEEVRRLTPDFAEIAKIQARGVIVTAKSDKPDVDFVSRFFAPQSGVAEDPVTGSAHCCLGPYWRAELGKDELVGFQVSKRGGKVRVRCAGDRVILGGSAVMVVEGILKQH